MLVNSQVFLEDPSRKDVKGQTLPTFEESMCVAGLCVSEGINDAEILHNLLKPAKAQHTRVARRTTMTQKPGFGQGAMWHMQLRTITYYLCIPTKELPPLQVAVKPPQEVVAPDLARLWTLRPCRHKEQNMGIGVTS